MTDKEIIQFLKEKGADGKWIDNPFYSLVSHYGINKAYIIYITLKKLNQKGILAKCKQGLFCKSKYMHNI